MSAENGHRAKAVFITAISGFLLSMFYRVSVTVISPELTEEFGLSSMRLSTLSSAFFYAFAALQIPAGPALDRTGPRRTMFVLGLLAVAGALTFGFGQSYPQLLIGRILIGLGMACNLMGAFTLISAWFPANRFATLAGVLTGAGTAGMLLAATPLAWMAETVGWRWAFLAIAALNLVQLAVFYRVVRDSPGKDAGHGEKSASPRELLSSLGYLWTRHWFWAVCLATFFRFGAFMSLQALLAGPYLIYGHGLSSIQTGNALTACTLGYIASLPLSGRLSDKDLNTRKYVVSPAILITAVLFVFLSRLPAGTSLYVYFGLFAAIGVFSAPGNIVYAHIKELCPREMTGTAMTGINLFNMLGPAVLIQVGGAFMPENPATATGPQDFSAVWLIFAAGLAASGLVYLTVPDTRRVRG